MTGSEETLRKERGQLLGSEDNGIFKVLKEENASVLFGLFTDIVTRTLM